MSVVYEVSISFCCIFNHYSWCFWRHFARLFCWYSITGVSDVLLFVCFAGMVSLVLLTSFCLFVSVVSLVFLSICSTLLTIALIAVCLRDRCVCACSRIRWCTCVYTYDVTSAETYAINQFNWYDSHAHAQKCNNTISYSQIWCCCLDTSRTEAVSLRSTSCRDACAVETTKTDSTLTPSATQTTVNSWTVVMTSVGNTRVMTSINRGLLGLQCMHDDI